MDLERKMDDKEYFEQLQKTLEALLSKTKAATTEASVASAFEIELSCFMKSYLGKDIVFDKEIGQSDLKHKRHVFTGRMDAVSNNLVIEYKKRKKLETEKDQKEATAQIEGYLNQLYRENGAEYNGVLTDGFRIRYFYFVDRTLHHTPFKEITAEDLDKLVKNLLNVQHKRFVPSNIIQDFKFDSQTNVTKKLAQSLFQMIQKQMTDKTDMLFQEWQELFHLSENDRGQNLDIEKRKAALGRIFDLEIQDVETDYKALFVLQTTYAIIVKLIACKVVSRIAGSSRKEIVYFSDLTKVDSNILRDFMGNLEDGYSFAIGGIRNLLEGDFFSWYVAPEQWNEQEAQCIKEIIQILEGYSTTNFSYGYTAIDIFKDLYMEIMPNEVRHSLGEYFTPSWLADYVIDSSIKMVPERSWRAIDPCCGSGIFVVSLIRRILEDVDVVSLSAGERRALLGEVIERVQGIDINPLSVLTARVSYLLAIAPLMQGDAVEIPIYLGDSANIPHIEILDGVKCYQYIVTTKQGNIEITLPCSFVEDKRFLERMSLLQTIIKAEREDVVYAKLSDYINDDELNEAVCAKIRGLSNRLVELRRKKWDGIWLRIVTNYMLVARIRDMDIIVGNPPWVKWEFLPQMYAKKIKDLCLDRHLFSGQTYMGAISLNICALISNVTGSSWLKKHGVLSFLMPKTLMTQDSYAGFRNFYTNVKKGSRLYLQKVDEWSKAGDPFLYTNEKFLTYYYQDKFVDYKAGLPIQFFEKKKGIDIRNINLYNKYTDALPCFKCRMGKAYQLDDKRTGFTMIASEDAFRTELYEKIIGESSYKARSGVEFTPAEVYFVEPLGEGTEEGRYRFTNSEFAASVYKAKKNDGFELETGYVKPVIKSPSITEFGIAESGQYCIFPYDFGEIQCVSLEDLSRTHEYTAAYLIANKEMIEKQSKRSRMIAKGDEFYALSKLGKYNYGAYAVAFRDNTRLVASVVEPVLTAWGKREMPVCAKHAPYISMDKKGRFITEEEAHFLCGILNTNVVQEYFRFTFSGRSYSIDFNIYLPLLDEENPLHQRIVELAKEAHANYTNSEIVQARKEEIEKLYLQICEERVSYRKGVRL